VIARDVDDPALLLRVLTACGCINVYNHEAGQPLFADAIGLARARGDGWRLSETLSWQAFMAHMPVIRSQHALGTAKSKTEYSLAVK
jgi:hypothetical protein